MKSLLGILIFSVLICVSNSFADENEFKDPEGAMKALKTAGEDVREKAAEYLGDIRYAKATDALLEALNDASDDVRKEAARALGKIEAKSAVDPLILHLSEGHSGVRAASAEALARIGDTKALEPMRKQLAAEINPINQVRMGRALKSLEVSAQKK